MEIIKQMKLLVNDKELAHYLISLIDLKDHCAHIELDERKTAEAIHFIIEKRDHHKFDIEKFRDKFKEKLVRGISADGQSSISRSTRKQSLSCRGSSALPILA